MTLPTDAGKPGASMRSGGLDRCGDPVSQAFGKENERIAILKPNAESRNLVGRRGRQPEAPLDREGILVGQVLGAIDDTL